MMTLLFMFFMHIVDDYYLQKGLLAFMKQKSWWKKQEDYDPMYRFDYIVGLVMHSFSWAFMIMLPIAYRMSFDVSGIYLVALFLNMAIHCFVDDLKANKKKINLVVDQVIHIAQIVVTFLIFLSLGV